MFAQTVKWSALLTAAIVGVFLVAETSAQAQYYHYRGGNRGVHYHNVRSGNYYRGSSCQSYRTYRPAVSVGYRTARPVTYYGGGFGYPAYSRRVSYGRVGYGRGYYGGYPGYYGNRGGISIGIRF